MAYRYSLEDPAVGPGGKPYPGPKPQPGGGSGVPSSAGPPAQVPTSTLGALGSTAQGPAGVGGTGGFGFVNIGQYLAANPNSNPSIAAPTPETGGQYGTTTAPAWNGSTGYSASGGYTPGMAALDSAWNNAYGRGNQNPYSPPGTPPASATTPGPGEGSPAGSPFVPGGGGGNNGGGGGPGPADRPNMALRQRGGGFNYGNYGNGAGGGFSNIMRAFAPRFA